MILPFTSIQLTMSALLRALPWALFATVSLYALIAINGFGVKLPFVGFVGVEGYAPANTRLKADLAAVIVGQDTAKEIGLAAKKTAEQILGQVTQGVEQNARILDAAADDATARFAAANRVRCPSTGSAPGQANTAAPDNGTGSAQGAGGMPELAGVLVPERDVRICADNTVKAIAGYKFATEIERVTAEANRESD